jgi:hypothetical protein
MIQGPRPGFAEPAGVSGAGPQAELLSQRVAWAW